MKKFVFLFILGIITLSLQAQNKNGTVYSEHELIDKSRALWTAFVNNDKESLFPFYADSVHLFVNGHYSKVPKQSFESVVDWWKGVSNKKAMDDTGTFPDAIEYEEGGTWVQDWIRLTGTHEKSGVEINVQVHNLYLFDENAKISAFHQYFDDSFYDEIANILNPSALPAEDREYILNTYKVIEERWNNGDRSAYINRYNEKTIYMLPNQEFLEGIHKIKPFVNSFPESKQEYETVEIWGGSNFATVRGIYRGLDTEGNVFDKGKFISSWQKDSEGNWNITHDIWNSDFPATTSGSND